MEFLDRVTMGFRTKLIIGLIGLVSAAAGVPAQEFVPDDQIVSDPTIDIRDPEFDGVGFRMVWQDRTNQLWVADLDPETGDIIPSTGMGQLIDSGLSNIAAVKNGPEWSYGAGEALIAYSRRTQSSHRLAVARQDTGGAWVTELLQNGADRWRPEGTPPENTEPARIAYIRKLPSQEEILSWRTIDDPNSEGSVAQPGTQGGRWADTERAVVAMELVDGVMQIMWIDIDTAQKTQITFGSSRKFNPFVFRAPEFGDLAFSVMINTTQIGIYRRTAPHQWQLHYTFSLPSGKGFVSSPEVFIHNGKSYVVAVAAEALGSAGFPLQPSGPSEIWIAGIDPANPFFRRIDEGTDGVLRSEPEPLTLSSGTVVYYTQNDASTGKALVRRADTGLGPSWGYRNSAYGGPWAAMHRDNKNCACTPFEIADQYEATSTAVLTNAQTLRPTIGPGTEVHIPLIAPGTGDTFNVTIDGNTGQELFRISELTAGTNLAAASTLIDADGNFYIASSEFLTKFEPTGSIVWTISIPGFSRSAQFLPDGNLVMFTWNGWAYVVAPQDGTVLLEDNLVPWRSFPPDPPSCQTSATLSDCAFIRAPAVDGKTATIYVTYITGGGNSTVLAYRYDSVTFGLTRAWAQSSAILPGAASSPVISADGSRLYIQGENDLVALDASDGSTIWTFALGFGAIDPPVVNDNGLILPGGTYSATPGYDFIGLIEDTGDQATWLFQDHDFRPVSFAAAGRADRFVIGARDLAGNVHLLVVDPNGIVSAAPWNALPVPNMLRGLGLREDGRVYLHARGQNAYSVFDPVAPAP